MTSDVAEGILALQLGHPVRVAVDGRSAAGKTTFADRLAVELRKSGREVIRGLIDSFHRPAAERHRQGRFSADGYYEDARDLRALRTLLLDPLGPDGDRSYAIETFDLEGDLPIEPVFHEASSDAILIFDGTFLQRPELRSAWDFVVFLDVPADEAQRRGVVRDADILGGRENTAKLYNQRYEPAFVRYERECAPADRADVVISWRNNSTEAGPSDQEK